MPIHICASSPESFLHMTCVWIIRCTGKNSYPNISFFLGKVLGKKKELSGKWQKPHGKKKNISLKKSVITKPGPKKVAIISFPNVRLCILLFSPSLPSGFSQVFSSY